MKLGTMKAQLPWALEEADLSFCHSGGLGWDAARGAGADGRAGGRRADIDELVDRVVAAARAGRPRPVHEQRRLRRHPREAARRAGAAAAAPRHDGAAPPHRRAVTHLLYLHGFRSSPQSTKAREVRRLGRGAPARAWSGGARSCRRRRARRCATLMRGGIAPGRRERMAVIGSSLGGFYATVVAERAGCRAVLLNPAVDPARDLARHDRRDDGLAQRRAVRLPARVRRRAARDRAAGAADATRSATSPSSPRATRCSSGAR